jgi:excinuclease ABC subunit C
MIECYDVSTLQGKSSVGSLVVFKNGIPYKKGYRRFKIRSIVGQDDPAMIGEIIYRRFKRHLEEKTSLPDLVIVDGGLTQMRSAQRSLRDLGIEIAVIGLAKEFENIYTINHNTPLNLPSDSDALYLLQRIRNEAHRFAISYHRKLREKIM